jgi:hypothetical protein
MSYNTTVVPATQSVKQLLLLIESLEEQKEYLSNLSIHEYRSNEILHQSAVRLNAQCLLLANQALIRVKHIADF